MKMNVGAIVVGVVSFALGIGGALALNPADKELQPAPTVTVTKTAKPEPVLDPSCADAVDAAKKMKAEHTKFEVLVDNHLNDDYDLFSALADDMFNVDAITVYTEKAATTKEEMFVVRAEYQKYMSEFDGAVILCEDAATKSK